MPRLRSKVETSCASGERTYRLSVLRGRRSVGGFGLVWAVLLGSFLFSCGLGEADFQGAWKRRLMDIVPSLQEFIRAHGQPPSSLDEIPGYRRVDGQGEEGSAVGRVWVEGRWVDLGGWVHYRREGNDETVVFMCREEIESGFDGSRSCSEDGRPREGDVFVRLGASGEVIAASWSR